jgi:DNA-binding transcriptional LysR family regulator
LAAAFPRSVLAAGHIDAFNGDFVPAIEVDVPMQLARLSSGSDVIAVGAFAMVEEDLKAGRLAVIPTAGIKLDSSYGFIHLKIRALSPAAQALMREFRDEEARCSEREKELERRFLTGGRKPSQAREPFRRLQN